MTEGKDILDWVGLSGILSILLGAFGYGRLAQRVDSLESSDPHAQQIAIARLDERLKAMSNDIDEIKRAVVK